MIKSVCDPEKCYCEGLPYTPSNEDFLRHGLPKSALPEPFEEPEGFDEDTWEEGFVVTMHHVARKVHDMAVEKGFWDPLPGQAGRNDSEMIMLAVTELAEAVEGIRTGNKPDDKIPDFSAAEAEFADCIIRLMDQATARGWRLPEAICAKIRFNSGRPYKHGKQF